MKTIITGLLSKAFKMENGKIAELIKDGNELSETEQTEILNKILDLDAERYKTLKENVTKEIGTEKFQEGFKKDKKEILEQREKELKEKFGIESSKTGIDLVEEIVSLKSEKGKGGNMDEDAIKRSKLYQDLEAKARTEAENIKTEYENKIKEINDGYNYEKTFSDVSSEALKIFNGLNPVLPQNKTVADNQVGNFISTLKNYKFDKQGDRILVMDKEGKVIQDNHGNSKSFEDIIKESASGLFEFKKNNGGGGGGNENDPDKSKPYTGGIPKTVDELEKVMMDTSIPIKDRVNIQDEFEKAQKGIE
jgi:hypothetical protein